MSSDDEKRVLQAAEDAVSTGPAADSADCDERLKGLPRLLRYAMRSTDGSQHLAERLIAEIQELCPQLPHNAAWALERTLDTGLALAAELDRRAAAQDEPNLRSLADCVRLLSLPTPHDSDHFAEHQRVGKALLLAFHASVRHAEQELCCDLERFTFGWAALPVCTAMVSRSMSATTNAAYLGGQMAEHRIAATKAAVRQRLEEEHRKQQKAEEKEKTAARPSPAW